MLALQTLSEHRRQYFENGVWIRFEENDSESTSSSPLCSSFLNGRLSESSPGSSSDMESVQDGIFVDGSSKSVVAHHYRCILVSLVPRQPPRTVFRKKDWGLRVWERDVPPPT